MITPRTPSVMRIVWTDYWAALAAIFLFPFLALIFIFGILPMLLDSRITTNLASLLTLLIGAAFWTLIFGGALAWRITVIRSVFADGQDVRGQISEVGFSRDHGTVKYSYTYMGTNYTGSNRVMKNGRTGRLAAGAEAGVMVDTGDPRRAFLKDLYL